VVVQASTTMSAKFNEDFNYELCQQT
jgi:hypothetical protein